MASHYQRGQKVIIVPSKEQSLTPRDAKIEPYIGRSGVITDYYWIDVPTGDDRLYVYTVKMKEENKEVVVYEDEIRVFVD